MVSCLFNFNLFYLTLYLGKAFLKTVAKLSSPSTPSKSDAKGSKQALPTPAKSDKAPTPAKPTEEEGEGKRRLRKRKEELPPEKKGKEEMSDKEEQEEDDFVSSFFLLLFQILIGFLIGFEQFH